jgi:hypothetical protein
MRKSGKHIKIAQPPNIPPLIPMLKLKPIKPPPQPLPPNMKPMKKMKRNPAGTSMIPLVFTSARIAFKMTRSRKFSSQISLG